MRWWHSRSAQFEETADERFRGTRFFILPPGMVPVPRTSPIRARKRTPWHPKPEDHIVDRTGGRDWFGTHLTLQPQRQHKPASYGIAGIVHITVSVGFIALVLLREGQSNPPIRQPFMVPVLLSLPSASKLFPPPAAPAQATPSRSAPPPAAPLGAAPAAVDEPISSAPVQIPDTVKPEPQAGPVGLPTGVESGIPGGVSGGVAGAPPDGGGQAANGAASGPLRMGPGIEPPRKIKDVKAVYPEGSLIGRLRGTVVIEATIGTDGKVHEAKVLRSIAGLDQAALDAVRQWEFEPARLNGAPVAVIMTVTVSFAIV